MPKEVRAILFSEQELKTAIEMFLLKGLVAGKAQRIERVEIELIKGAVNGRAHTGSGAEARVVMLGPPEMMTAVLMLCGSLRIPLSTRAAKQLDIASGCLMMTMSLNQGPAAGPRVKGNVIDYSAPMPPELADRVGVTRE